MRALVIGDGRTMKRVVITHAEAVRLSKMEEIAAVVSTEATMNGRYPLYMDGCVKQYDPVSSRVV